jgi:endosialidase-like protein
MADGATPNHNFVLPEVGASADSWGSKLNSNWSALDTILGAPASGGGTGYMPITGGTFTGNVQVAGNPPVSGGNLAIGYTGSNLPSLAFNGQDAIGVGPAGNLNFTVGGTIVGHFDNTDFYATHNVYAGNGTSYIGTNASGYTTVQWDANHYIYIGPGGAWNFMLNGSLCANLSTDLTITTGTGWKPGGGSWANYSDARIKDVKGEYTRGTTDILMLQPRVYRYKGNDGDSHPTDRDFVGLVAQEVEDFWPELVKHTKGRIDDRPVDDLRTLDTSELIYALVNTCQQLHRRLRVLERNA